MSWHESPWPGMNHHNSCLACQTWAWTVMITTADVTFEQLSSTRTAHHRQHYQKKGECKCATEERVSWRGSYGSRWGSSNSCSGSGCIIAALFVALKYVSFRPYCTHCWPSFGSPHFYRHVIRSRRCQHHQTPQPPPSCTSTDHPMAMFASDPRYSISAQVCLTSYLIQEHNNLISGMRCTQEVIGKWLCDGSNFCANTPRSSHSYRISVRTSVSRSKMWVFVVGFRSSNWDGIWSSWTLAHWPSQ